MKDFESISSRGSMNGDRYHSRSERHLMTEHLEMMADRNATNQSIISTPHLSVCLASSNELFLRVDA
jgi:hypothetical protein